MMACAQPVIANGLMSASTMIISRHQLPDLGAYSLPWAWGVIGRRAT